MYTYPLELKMGLTQWWESQIALIAKEYIRENATSEQYIKESIAELEVEISLKLSF